MLKSFLAHHADRAARGVKYNAIKNCHVQGLDSVVLHDEPGNRIRMFATRYVHGLCDSRSPSMNLAIHAHHCDVRFVGIFGEVFNDRYRMVLDPEGDYNEMDYVSAITGSHGSLTPTGHHGTAISVGQEPLSANPVMRADEMHTIYAHKGYSAWLVIEGAEDGDYDSRCWTRNTMPVDFTKLYLPMSQAEVAQILQMAVDFAN